MKLALEIPALFISAFFIIWAMNVSFAAHLQEESAALKKYHVYSYILTLISLVVISIPIFFR
jgi:hypothetical protein